MKVGEWKNPVKMRANTQGEALKGLLKGTPSCFNAWKVVISFNRLFSSLFSHINGLP